MRILSYAVARTGDNIVSRAHIRATYKNIVNVGGESGRLIGGTVGNAELNVGGAKWSVFDGIND